MPRDAITILHLSDPQFGKNHVFGRRALPIADGKHDTLLARTCEDLDKLKSKWGLAPDLVVLTGDLAEWGTKDEFQQCFDFLGGIGAHLAITPQQRHRIVVIPGNHDINRNLANAEYAEWLANDKKGDPFGFRRFEFYAAALKKFYAKVPKELRPVFDKKHLYGLVRIPDLNIVLACLNSVLAECHLETANARKQLGKDTIYGHHGWCGEAQYKHFARELAAFEKDGWLRIGLVHHNVIRGATSDDENLKDANDLRTHLGSVLNLLLHGHTHIADRGLLPDGQPILSTGSASLSHAQRPDETPNQYQVLRVTAAGVEAWMRSFDHHERRWFPDSRVGGEQTSGRLRLLHTFSNVSSALGSGAQAVEKSLVEPDTASPKQLAGDDASDRVEYGKRDASGAKVMMESIATLRWPGSHCHWHDTAPPYLNVVTNEDYGFRSFVIGLSHISDDPEHSLNAFDRLTNGISDWERWFVAQPGLEALENWKLLVPEGAQRGIRLLSWRDFERMSDLRIAIEQQKNDLLASKEYPPALYIPQGIEFFPPPKPGQSADEVEPLPPVEDGFAELTQRITGGGPSFFLIDGDFGAGKTFLLHQLALHFSRDATPVIPLLIELRSLDKVQNATDMLITRLGRLGQQEIRPAQLAYMAEAGHLLILFDGYDELALRVNFDRAADHLSTITEAARGKATVVLTCRTQHFKDDHQMVVRLLDQPGLCRARLRPFSEAQILAFLEKKLGSQAHAQKRFALIHDIKDLLGLSENPRMLSFIADLPEGDLVEAQRSSPDGKITAARLYETIMDRWLRNEVRRHSHLQQKDAASGTGVAPTSKSDTRYLAELWEAVTRLAFMAWGRMERPFEIEEIQQAIREVSKNLLDTTLADDERTHGIASGSLLSREGVGAFAFAHYSIPEFLVARDLARQLRPKEGMPSVLPCEDARACFAREAISDLMAEFLVDELGMHDALDQALYIASVKEDETGRKNAGRMLDVCRKRLETATAPLKDTWEARLNELVVDDMGGMDLRGRNLANGNYRRAYFDGSDLTQATLRASDLRYTKFANALLVQTDLSHCDLREADLSHANFTEADLSYADLRGANLTDANFTRATLIGTDLRGAEMVGSQWEMARLAGATLDDPQLSGLRAWGAGFPGATHSPVLWVGASYMRSGTWSPGREVVATGHDNGCVTLWDAHKHQVVHTLQGHSDAVLSVAFSPSGCRIATGSADRTIRLWDVRSGRLTHVLRGHMTHVMCLAFSPDSSQLASGSSDNSVRLWDASDGQTLHILRGHLGSVMGVAFAPDGSHLASCSYDNTVRLWNVHSGQILRILRGHSGSVLSVAFAPDGSCLASGSDDKTLRLWNTNSGQVLQSLQGHERAIRSVAFDGDGSRIASGSDDNTLRLWDARSGQCLQLISGHSGPIKSVAFDVDGSLIAGDSCNDMQRMSNAKSGQVWSVAFAPGGSCLASSASDKTLRLWDAQHGQVLHSLKGHGSTIRSVAFDAEGDRIASGSDDNTLRLWDAHSGHCMHVLKEHFGPVTSVAFSPDKSRLASGSSDRTIWLWNPKNGQPVGQRMEGHYRSVTCLAFFPDGVRLISGSDDKTLRRWNILTGQAIGKPLEGHSESVTSLAFSPDGSCLASGSNDRTIRFWDVQRRCKPIGEPLKGHQAGISTLAFSPDGNCIASGSADNTLRLWDARSGKCLQTLQGHTGSVNSVAFWPGRRVGGPALLVSASEDGTIRLWDTEAGTCLGILLAHGDAWAALRPDGRYRAVGKLQDYLWHVSGLVRYELGELDEVDPRLKLAEDEPLIPPAYFAK